MDEPGKPHVRNVDGRLFIERVPNAWVYVCPADLFSTLQHHEKQYLIGNALKHGMDQELPDVSVSGQ